MALREIAYGPVRWVSREQNQVRLGRSACSDIDWPPRVTHVNHDSNNERGTATDWLLYAKVPAYRMEICHHLTCTKKDSQGAILNTEWIKISEAMTSFHLGHTKTHNGSAIVSNKRYRKFAKVNQWDDIVYCNFHH